VVTLHATQTLEAHLATRAGRTVAASDPRYAVLTGRTICAARTDQPIHAILAVLTFLAAHADRADKAALTTLAARADQTRRAILAINAVFAVPAFEAPESL
jgi:tRNA U38,U39,U40 pseudouridine synthase TruA